MSVGMGNNGDCVGFGNDVESHFIGDSMKYISEERLKTLLGNTSYITANDLLRVLINECKELNPWQTIESGPKDRRVLYYSPRIGIFTGHDSGHYFNATHWMELPQEPQK